MDQYLTIDELNRRRNLRHSYFIQGKLYVARNEYRGLVKRDDTVAGIERKKILITKGDFLLCTKVEPIEGEEYARIEFIYKEVVLSYLTDGFALCGYLDLVEMNNE